MTKDAKAGLLLHISSLPSPHGVGDIGGAERVLLPFLKKTGNRFWQILPLNPVGYGESPYQSFSAFAGNEDFISPEKLTARGWLHCEEIAEPPDFPETRVDFHRMREWKSQLYHLAYQRFKRQQKPDDYHRFIEEQRWWLEDYALFTVIKKNQKLRPWQEWPEKLKNRSLDELRLFREQHLNELECVEFLQYCFHTQWQEMKKIFWENNIRLIGDLPIFVAHDSADVWANPRLFQLNPDGTPTVVAGVPPDYFSRTGQRWGNPHYRWDKMMKDDFSWWRMRLQHLMESVDMIRIDHFRGFEAYWEIHATEPTAVKGRWVKAPGMALFHSLEKYLGKLPLIAEDLGVITPEVEALKKAFGFPGMKILQFSFGKKTKKKERPAYYEKHTVAYTGTHDNDTLVGWLKEEAFSDVGIREILKRYHRIDPEKTSHENCQQLIRLLMHTHAKTVVIPLQDYLCLGTASRMNYPGTIGGTNWQWQATEEQLSDSTLQHFIYQVIEEAQRH
ncbi:4-alpha-glucanotransferase [Anoxynatronum sibiricum]|uniref:4-alpha-glucanotransferase n=1 Tax=Anoxynatronum sibiricum TaxID=210623 RepID=A0ABU9VY91_9CLOT